MFSPASSLSDVQAVSTGIHSSLYRISQCSRLHPSSHPHTAEVGSKLRGLRIIPRLQRFSFREELVSTSPMRASCVLVETEGFYHYLNGFPETLKPLCVKKLPNAFFHVGSGVQIPRVSGWQRFAGNRQSSDPLLLH